MADLPITFTNKVSLNVSYVSHYCSPWLLNDNWTQQSCVCVPFQREEIADFNATVQSVTSRNLYFLIFIGFKLEFDPHKFQSLLSRRAIIRIRSNTTRRWESVSRKRPLLWFENKVYSSKKSLRKGKVYEKEKSTGGKKNTIFSSHTA